MWSLVGLTGVLRGRRAQINLMNWPKGPVHIRHHHITVINILPGKPLRAFIFIRSKLSNSRGGFFFKLLSIWVQWRQPIIVIIALENALRLTWGLTQSKRLKGRLTDDLWPSSNAEIIKIRAGWDVSRCGKLYHRHPTSGVPVVFMEFKHDLSLFLAENAASVLFSSFYFEHRWYVRA